jgi:uncharacterized protein (DUF1810 family)
MLNNKDVFNLQRFLNAQKNIYSQVESELNNEKKETHWMWYIFPQIDGLGNSHITKQYALESLEEAIAYLNHPVLGQRLIECTEKVFIIEGKLISDIFDNPDDLKFKSSMTLFSLVTTSNSIFSQVLKKYFYGEKDVKTLTILNLT